MLASYLGLRLAVGAPVDPLRFGLLPLIGNIMLVQAWDSVRLTWNNVAWSISAEWAAYLGFPIMAFAHRLSSGASGVIGATASIFVTVVLLRVFYGELDLNVAKVHVLPRVGGESAAGCFLYWRWQVLPWAAITAIAFCAFLVQVFLLRQSFAALPAIVILVIGLAHGRGGVAYLLSTPTAIFLGEISYPFYMLHYFVIEAAESPLQLSRHAQNELLQIVLFGVGLLLTFIMALMMHHYLEKPARRRLRTILDELLPPLRQ